MYVDSCTDPTKYCLGGGSPPQPCTIDVPHEHYITASCSAIHDTQFAACPAPCVTSATYEAVPCTAVHLLPVCG